MKSAWIAAALAAAGAVTVLDLARPRPVAAADETSKPAFVGAETCKKCHMKQHKSWKETPMAKTFEVLAAGKAVDPKKAAGLDPAKDYSSDAGCLACHTTGYGTETGHPAPPEAGKEWTAEEKDRAARTRGVTCEACHGPGSLYIPFKKANQETFKIADLKPLGSTSPPTAEQCLRCHEHEIDAGGKLVKGCPTMPKDYKFDFEKSKKEPGKTHEHVALKHDHR